MIDLVAKLKEWLASLSAADAAAVDGFEYAKVEHQLKMLHAAVRAAIAADEADAHSYWTDIKSKVLDFLPFVSANEKFKSEADQLTERAKAELLLVEALCDSAIGAHKDVPRTLDGDQRAWRKNGRQVQAKIESIQNLPPMIKWRGDAKREYQATVSTQINAMKELEGIMVSTAQSCLAGAQLNRAIFLVVDRAIRMARGAIEDAPGSGFLMFYRRTSTAIQVLEDLKQEVEEAARGSVADGSSNALRREHRNTINMPNLLRVGMWPTGTTGAYTKPADTAKGVRGDGKDADLRVDNNTGSDGEGVKL